MLVYLCVGAVCFKTKLVTNEGNKSLSNLVLYVANPLLILVSYQQDFSVKLLKGLGQTLLLTALGYAVFIALGIVFVKNKDGVETAIERFSVIYSNCGFMGIPIAKVLLGSEGVFYITAFNTVFNLLVWTHGVVLISGDKRQINIKKVATNPTIIATLVGFILFVTRVSLPEILFTACNNISLTVAPLAMIVAGVTIAQTNPKKAFANMRVYYVTFLKLVLIPFAVILLFKFLPFAIDQTVLITTILAFACPSATICTMFSIRFDKNDRYSAEIFAVTTILSVASMPVMIYLQSLL